MGTAPATYPTVKPGYQYTGACGVYATYGRYEEASFIPAPANTEVLFSAPVSNPINYDINVESENSRDKWGDKKGNYTPTLDITESYVNGQKVLRLRGFPVGQKHTSINPKEPNPFIGGLWAAYYEALPQDLTSTEYVRVRVRPRTEINLIIELYELDGSEPAKAMADDNWCTPEKLKGLKTIGKQKYNYCLPESDDQFKAVIHLKPRKDNQFQTLYIPKAAFVDWNKKQPSCSADIPGINQDIGNGVLDPQKGDAFVIQFTVVGTDWKFRQYDLEIEGKVDFLITNKPPSLDN